MRHETKYNIGDKVWIIYHNKVIECEIMSIRICAYKSILNNYEKVIKENYELFSGKEYITRELDLIYQSKDELLKSL